MRRSLSRLTRVVRRLLGRGMQEARVPAEQTLSDVFTAIYRTNSWQNAESRSGHGSTVARCRPVMRALGTPIVPPHDDAGLDTNLGDYVHAARTCRMGSVDDKDAVVDPACAVIGYEGLWVCDASVMPDLPRANTHLTTVVVAEPAYYPAPVVEDPCVVVVGGVSCRVIYRAGYGYGYWNRGCWHAHHGS